MKNLLLTLTIVFYALLTVKSQEAKLADCHRTFIEAEGEVTWRHENAFVEYPETDTWEKVTEIPEKRRRSSTGAVIYKNKISIGGGIKYRHASGTTNHDWEKLFNGENLKGWQVKCQEKDRGHAFWSVDEGAILCNSIGSKNHGYVWLMNKKEFDDFELRLKFKVSRETSGNSGIQIRSRYDEEAIVDENGHAGWLDGPQVDINPDNPWRNGLIYDETREARRWINPSLPDWNIDKENHAPKNVIFYWEDEESGWNNMTIICRGTRIKTIVNNVVVSDYDGAGILDDKAHQKHNVGLNGHIALQLHKNSENKIWFKDIEIRDIE
jgi:hypothetical protein